MTATVGESIDQAVSLEMRHRDLPRGVIRGLYEAVRGAGEPLTLQAASRLKATLEPNDNVVIATGAGDPVWLPRGETDGPLGAAVLARVLDLGLGVRTMFACTDGYETPIAAAAEACGLSVTSWELARKRRHASAITRFPVEERARTKARARDLIDEVRPKAVIAVEVKGATAAGALNYMSGREAPGESTLDELFQLAELSDTLSVGIGDGGNEVGFGAHADAVRLIHPNGTQMACVVPCQVTVVAAISNWGAYGIEAALAYLLGDSKLIHDECDEARMLDAAVRAGAGDGVFTRQVQMVDGQPLRVQQALVTILRQIVDNALTDTHYALM